MQQNKCYFLLSKFNCIFLKQTYRKEYGCYFEVLLQLTLKKAYNSNNNTITKKINTKYLVDYYEGRLIDPECLEKNSINQLKE